MANLKERKPDFNRLRKVLLREGTPDAVPFYDLFADDIVISKATGKPCNDESTVEFFQMLGYDYSPVWIGPGYGERRITTNDTAELTGGTRSFADENHGIIESRGDYDSYKWPEPEEWQISGVKGMARYLPDGMKLIVSLKGIFESVMYLMSLVPLCYAIHEDEQLVVDIFENVGNTHCAMINKCLDTMDLSKIGAVCLCEDMGFVQGTFLPPEIMRKYVFPWMKKFTQIVHAYDLPLIMHACGNLEKVMDDLIDYVGIDAKQSFEDKYLTITDAKKRYGKRIAVVGGIDVNFLCVSSEEQVRQYVRDALKICMEGGGYALGTGNSVPNYIPYINYLAMLDEGRKFM